MEETNKIVEDHKMQWKTYNCSIEMDKWTAKMGKWPFTVLVNSAKISVFFLELYDANNSSTNSNKIFNLFEKTILKIGKKKFIEVVTDNASENKKAGDTLKRAFLHICWIPCYAHYINLIFGDIFKKPIFC